MYLSLLGLFSNPKWFSFGNPKTIAIITDQQNKSASEISLMADSVLIWHSVTNENQLSTIYDVQAIPTEHFDSLLIVGAGFSQEDLKRIPSIPSRRIAEKSEGITSIKAKKQIRENDEWVLSAQIENPSEKALKIKVVLKDIVLDSLISNSNKITYRFSDYPKIGQNLYQIELIAEGMNQVLPIGVEVKENRKREILVLERSVGFETKYLVEALAEVGHHIQWEREISSNVKQHLSFNTQKTNLSISENEFKKYDFIVTDWEKLNQLSANERKQIRNYVDKGGNVIVLTPFQETYREVALSIGIQIQEFNQEQTLKIDVIPQWNAKKDTSALFLSIWQTQLKAKNTTMFMQSASGLGIQWKAKIGLGTIVFGLSSDTYPWILQGKKEFYSAYWNGIQEQLNLIVEDEIAFEQNLISENKSTQVKIFQPFELPEIGKLDSGLVSIWMNKSGWQAFTQSNTKETYSVYVNSKADVDRIDFANRYYSTSSYLAQNTSFQTNNFRLDSLIYLAIAFICWISLLIETRL